MMFRSRLALLGLTFFAVLAYASDTDDAKARFLDYWQAYVNGDYTTAVQFIDTGAVVGLAGLLQPTLTRALHSSDPQRKALATAFLQGVPAERRGNLSDSELFVQFMSLAEHLDPKTTALIKKARMQPDAVVIDRHDPNRAVIKYTISLQGETHPATEDLVRINGQWYLRPQEDVAAVAAKVRGLFGE